MTRTPPATWTPYGEGQGPQSADKMLLSEVMADYCLEQWGYEPEDVLARLQGTGEKHEVNGIASIVGFLSGLMLVGDLPTFVRPFGGGAPRPFAPGCWEIDDPRQRFATSAVDPDRWSEDSAPPTCWIFVDRAAYEEFWAEWCRPSGDAPQLVDDVQKAPDEHRDQEKAPSLAAANPMRSEGDPQRAVDEGRTKTPGAGPPPEMVPAKPARPRAILRLPDVTERAGISRSQIYKRMDLGEFPASVELGTRMVGWYEDEVDEWVAKRRR